MENLTEMLKGSLEGCVLKSLVAVKRMAMRLPAT